MKLLASIFTSGLMFVALSGCGSETSETSSQASDLDLGHEVTRPTVVKDLTVKPALRNLLPNLRAYSVSANAQVGANRCLANGVSAKFTQRESADTLFVKAVTVQGHSNLNRVCTREFQPQFEAVSTVIRYNSKKIKHVVFENVNEFDRDVTLEDILENRVVSTEAVVTNVVAIPRNGGISPSAFAYEISGNVYLGSNSCFASGVSAQFETKRVGNVLEVTAVTKGPRDHGRRMCPMVFQPVSVHIKTMVRGTTRLVSAVVVKNVDVMKNDVEVSSLIPRD
jgi:hypothetical protein